MENKTQHENNKYLFISRIVVPLAMIIANSTSSILLIVSADAQQMCCIRQTFVQPTAYIDCDDIFISQNEIPFHQFSVESKKKRERNGNSIQFPLWMQISYRFLNIFVEKIS